MNELKKAIERVLNSETGMCGGPLCMAVAADTAVNREALEHLREVYEAVKERL